LIEEGTGSIKEYVRDVFSPHIMGLPAAVFEEGNNVAKQEESGCFQPTEYREEELGVYHYKQGGYHPDVYYRNVRKDRRGTRRRKKRGNNAHKARIKEIASSSESTSEHSQRSLEAMEAEKEFGYLLLALHISPHHSSSYRIVYGVLIICISQAK